MLKGRNFLSALTISAAMAMPLAAFAEPDAETVVARVNGQDITIGHMIIARATLPQQYQQLPANVLYNAILDQLIQQSALEQAQTGEMPRHIKLSLENERRALIAAEEVERVMANAIQEGDVQAAYDAQYADGFGGDEFNASHILVASQEEADTIKADLDGGADFAETAKEKSTGPSGPNGGSLGWFGLGAMVPEFETAVVALEAGQVSEPVQTQFGWHVIKLNEKRKAAAPAFEEVQGTIARELREKAVENRVEELVSNADVERLEVEGLDPAILGDLGLVRN